ncbi:MAG TPA: tripartite tricarboxylate transporter substrate binding protein [Burkholderiales bacterium]|nr:tripartite tricarboxylate transporter substrate binding protein [Burkholderiales bacterium]
MKRTLFFAAALACAALAHAQGYPNRPIRMVVPWPPGQATDLAGRLMAQKMSEFLGQPIIVDNRAGAGGTIGTDNAAKSPPDGYTILAASSGPATVSPLLQKLPYNVEKDLSPVHLVGISPYLLVTYPTFPASNAKEFVELLRANPGKYSFASSGTGATAHLISEWFNSLAQVKAVHVPYKGSAQALTDVMTGQVAYAIETLAGTGPHVRAGKLKTFGISFEKGSALAPGVPALAQAASMPGFDVGAWLGLMVPAGTPREVIARLAAEADKALQTPEVRERLAGIGLEIIVKGPDEFAAYLKGESTRFAAIIRNGNIKLD